jgi:hypothetical protein
VKSRALGTGTARPVTAPQTSPPASRPRTVSYARVEARDPKGVPVRLALPGALAAERVQLYVQWPDGSPAWAAEVTRDGELVGGRGSGIPPRERELSLITPATKIVAAVDPAGRVLALQALARLPDPSKAKRRSAAPSRTINRSRDPYEHDPNELIISGAAGRVLKVQ